MRLRLAVGEVSGTLRSYTSTMLIMRNSITRLLLAIGTLAVFAVLATSCGGDDGSIEVEDARYRLARPDLGTAYLSVTNTTGEDVRLESASAEGIGRIELHESLLGDDGTMSMQERPDGYVIADGETVTLEPGGKHLMLFDPVDPDGGDDLTITLDFGDETIDVVATFDADASAGSMDDMADMDDGDMDDGDMDGSADDG